MENEDKLYRDYVIKNTSVDVYENGSIEILANYPYPGMTNNFLTELDKELKTFSGLISTIEDNNETDGKVSGQKLIIHNSIKEKNRPLQKHIINALDKFSINYSNTGLVLLKQIIEKNDINPIKKNSMEDLKKIGNARTHEFKSGVKVFNVGIQKSKLEGVPLNQKGYFNASLIQEEDKIIIVAGKAENADIQLYINKNKLDQIPDNNGFANFTVAPKTKNENDLTTQTFNDFSAYVSAEGKDPIYIGGGNLPVKDNDLGAVYKETIQPKNGAEFITYDMVLDKQKLLSVPPSSNNNDYIYVNVGPKADNKNFLTAYPSPGSNDLNAIFTTRLDISKLLTVNEDEKGNIRLTVKGKQEKNISIDKANLSVSDASTRDLYVGKGWDVEHMHWRKNPEKGQDFFLQAGDVLQFKESNNYYLNNAMGIKDHTAYGTFAGLTDDGKIRIETIYGNFTFEKEAVRKGDRASLDNFNNSYESLVNLKSEEHKQKQTVKSKEAEIEKPNTNLKNESKKSSDNPTNKSKKRSNNMAL